MMDLLLLRLSSASLNITEQLTINNLNMPTFDMSRINGILYGANIGSATFNFNFNTNSKI